MFSLFKHAASHATKETARCVASTTCGYTFYNTCVSIKNSMLTINTNPTINDKQPEQAPSPAQALLPT